VQNLYTSNHPPEDSHPVPAIERKFKRHLDSLASVFDFIEHFVAQEGIDEEAKRAFDLAVDELFTNTVKYHPENPHDISIELRVDGEDFSLRLIDFDVDPFDITQKPDPELNKPLHERTPGGLGVYLTRKFVDNVEYQYLDRTSIITLKKSIGRKNV
jgi:serine/threonine-protein kinase RsbW